MSPCMCYICGTQEQRYLQGIRSNLFQMFVSAASLEDVMRIVPEADRAPTSSGAAPSGPEYSLITPNIVREARRHFGCPEMDSVLLNDVTFGIEPSELLSRRHYNVRFPTPMLCCCEMHVSHACHLHKPGTVASSWTCNVWLEAYV